MGWSLCCCKGNTNLQSNLEQGVENAKSRLSPATVVGRYHRLPQKLEDDYEVEAETVLGYGYNGAVRRARHKRSNVPFAVKSFRTKGISKAKAQMLRGEAEIYLTMDHPNIARLVDVYQTDNQLHLVMECMAGGELFDRIRSLGRFSEADAAQCIEQMLRAVSYLHSHGVVHRDLKLQNFLYVSPDSDRLKLIDFGFSQLWSPVDRTMKAFVGTLSYMAPEVLHFRARYTSQCDLWSLGVIAFTLLTGCMPFTGSESQQVRDIKAGSWRESAPAVLDLLSETAQDFVSRLLTVDPKARMTAAQALRHPFIQDRKRGRKSRGSKVEPAVVNALLSYSKASQLRRAVMEVMAWSLSNEEQEAVQGQFVAMDKNGEGTITLSELMSALSSVGISEEVCARIFKALDGAKDQEIHYSEFLAAMVSTRIVMHEELLRDTFRRFDTDNTGNISVENLKEMLGETFEGKSIEELLEDAGLPRNGHVSFEEFVQFLLNDDTRETAKAEGSSITRINSGPSKEKMRQVAVELIDNELEVASTVPSEAARMSCGRSAGHLSPKSQKTAAPETWCTRILALFRGKDSSPQGRSRLRPSREPLLHCGCFSPMLR